MHSLGSRSDKPPTFTHRDAHALVERGGIPALGEMYDDLERLVASRPSAIRVDVVRDDIPETYRRVDAVSPPIGAVKPVRPVKPR